MANDYKTLLIGTIFTYNGNKYKVCITDSKFNPCALYAFGKLYCDNLKSIRGYCVPRNRQDHIQVYYEQINDETMKKDCDNVINPTFNTDNSLNDLHIDCPKGYSIDVEHSDLSKGIIKFKNDNITLKDIYDNQGRDTFVTNVVLNNKHTYNKILAIAELMDIANYYNKDWKPDWNKYEEPKYYIRFSNNINKNDYDIGYRFEINPASIFFKNKEDAQAVIDNPNFRDILDTIYKD